jgi:plastocyanin
MKALWFLPLALAAASVASAQADDRSAAMRIDVGMSSFKYEPSTIVLEPGRPYLLHSVNRSGGGHDFVAKSFFAAATVNASDRSKVKNGLGRHPPEGGRVRGGLLGGAGRENG